MDGKAVLLSARIANLVGCKAMKMNNNSFGLNLSALIKAESKNICSRDVFCFESYRFTPLLKICSIVCLPRKNPPIIQKKVASKTLFLLHPIRQSSHVLNGFDDTRLKFTN